MGLLIAHFKGSWGEFSKLCCFLLSLKVVLSLTNSEDPDEMQHESCCISSGSSLFVKVSI